MLQRKPALSDRRSFQVSFSDRRSSTYVWSEASRFLSPVGLSSRKTSISIASVRDISFFCSSFFFLSFALTTTSLDMDELAIGVANVFVQEKVPDDGQKGIIGMASSSSSGELSEDEGCCAICLEKIELREIALVKGCEHAYCVTCILRWATYNQNPICPQCKNPFEFLIVHRALDGSVCDYMLEESVCLLLRANWFEPLTIEVREEVFDELEEFDQYVEGEDDDIDEFYFSGSSVLRIGNRRWGSNGYVRAGRKEARPVTQESFQDHPDDAGPSRVPKNKEVKVGNGRRAKRAMKREAADKAAAAAAKHL